MNKVIVSTISALSLFFGGLESHAGEQAGIQAEKVVPRGEIRIVDNNPLNWGAITYNVFEHLMEIDKDGRLVPRLATSWRWLDQFTLEVKLRRGVSFHNGEAFDAEVVKLNWDKNIGQWQPHSVGQYMNFAPGSRLEIVDQYTVRFHFSEVDGGALPKITSMHIANRQFYREAGWGEEGWCITKAPGPWGTGPYRLVEGYSVPDERTDQVVLEANTNYWDPKRFPRLKRVIFVNTLDQKEAVELVKHTEGRVDVVTGLSPLETLRVAESPFAKVVKYRGSLGTVIGHINMRKQNSPWRDVRLRRALNLAINRNDLIRYAAKGNGLVTPALITVNHFGYPAELAPYPFDPAKARRLIAKAGHSDGVAVELLAPESLSVQATVIESMLEQAGFDTRKQILREDQLQRRLVIPFLNKPAEEQSWDVALSYWNDVLNFPPYMFHHEFLMGGFADWVREQPELRRLQEQVLSTVDPKEQAALIRQAEKHIHDQAYLLFLYNPVDLYAVNKAVEFVPYITTDVILAETRVTDDHWSVRKTASLSGQ